ncbi:MAG TPA: PadR family transcriptional regulator [Candidatus Baltobacteraceae bacterium]|nr:PadR family transcriptional regulator [Candidatus Baltobacteraceae bacterium]
MELPAGDPRALVPLSSSAFYILLALAAEERHGYSIAKEVEDATNGSVHLGPGTLYRLIKQMVTDGWIVEVDRVDSEDPRRRYYRLTPWGRRIARAEAARLADAVRTAMDRRLLSANAFA